MIPASPVAPVSAADAHIARGSWDRLLKGGVVEARVLSVSPSGEAKLMVDGDQVSVGLSRGADLSAGDRVALRQAQGGGVDIVRLAPGQAADADLFAAARSVPSSSLSPSELAAARSQLAAGGSTQAAASLPLTMASVAPQGASPALAPEAQALAALRPMARQAMAGQAPLPEFFARLQAALDAPGAGFPPAARAAMAAVLATAFDPSAPLSEKSFRQAVEKSGVFLEAGGARDAGAARADLKASLMSLRALLVPLSAAQPDAATASGAARSVSDPASVREALASIASLPGDALSKLSPLIAALAARQTPGVRDALGRLLAASDPAALRASEGNPPQVARSGVDMSRPPIRGELPALQWSASAADEGVSLHERAASLLRGVDGALDRLRLLQFASLDGRPLAELARDGASGRQWQVELPLALPNGAMAALPLMIEREQNPRQGGERPDAVWRMRFTTESATLGAIDVAVAFQGGRIDVRFWADRPDTLALLEAGRDDLSLKLQNAAAPVEAINCQPGRRAAPRSAAQPGQFMDFRS
ncbi:MAG: flagellar hook-length control protein FliK [Rhizobiales bacterium]|nr:flagellar hook-length control protein FliK [Hyphomicrobiales bacterium]